MQCIRAAVVEYSASSSPLGLPENVFPDRIRVTVAIEGRVVRRLVPKSEVLPSWVPDAGRELIDAKSFPITTVDTVLVPDEATAEDLRACIGEIDTITKRWNTVVSHLAAAVPRKSLVPLVAPYLTQEEERVLRFGQQVEKAMALPSDSAGLERCLSMIDHLGAWVDGPAMCDIADVAFRLRARIEEDRSLLREETQEQHREAPSKALRDFHSQAVSGFCIPEKRIAFRGDTLFLYDGEYPTAEMQMLASEFMADLEKRITAAAIDRDVLKRAAEAEQPGLIPDRVRSLVWRRDNGRCVACGGVNDLEFDHVIPKSQGGASSAANVQVLCARCNERKGAQVAWLPFPRTAKTADGTLDLFRSPFPPQMGRDPTR